MKSRNRKTKDIHHFWTFIIRYAGWCESTMKGCIGFYDSCVIKGITHTKLAIMIVMTTPKFQANEIECCVYKVLNQQFFVSQSVVVVAYWTVHRMARAAGHWSTKYRISVLVKPRSGLLSKSSEKKIRRRWFDHKYDVYNLNINLSRDGRRWHPIHRQQAGSLTVRKISC